MEDIESYKQQLLETQQLLAETIEKLDTEKSARTEPIAIIGMAMRLPGKIKNAEDFWNVLVNGIDCIEEVPANRWDKDALYDSDPNTPGKLYIKEGGFIEDIEYLDGPFFNISPIELESTDPQQRILLEVAHESFENAGIDVNSLIGSDTGVFIGIDNVDYEVKQLRSGDYNLINGYCYTSTGPTGASGRISYTMGLRGPCMTIDTACSSALTCTHQAISALRNKDCKIALVGGASIITEPDQSLSFCRLGAQSPEARCKSFDDDANGYIRSEGVCTMVLKRLSDAQKDGDNVLAIIKGSAINQDGKSKRFTAPSTVAQGLMHTAAINNAQLQPADIDYIETHGTGTKVGDPAEVRGILFAYEKFRTKEKPLIISSNKSNFGHMECNSGMASVFKIILALKNNTIPKVIHLKKPNTLIDWENIPIALAKENIAWPKKENQPRFAGASSFGATGSNAHVIISDAPENKMAPDKKILRQDVFILPISAKSEQALKDNAKNYADFIKTSNHKLEDICAMAALRRAHFKLREVFVSISKEDLIEQLNDFSLLADTENKQRFQVTDKIKTIFIFPGQGAQWISMGKKLYDTELVFKSALDDCNHVFKKYVDFDLLEEINKPENISRLHEIDVVQPVIVAIEIALANLWMSKGVFPDMVIGHSLGEIAAAYVAGNITLYEAAQIICTRSKLMKQLSGKGEMGVTDLTVQEANEYLKKYENRLSVAVMNSTNSTVIAGEPAALHELFTVLEKEGRFNKKVKVDVASHSFQMDEIKKDLNNALQNLTPQNSSVEFYSTAKNQWMNGEDLNADYWSDNLRNPVQFMQAVHAATADNELGYAFVEMSPHPILIHAVNQNIEEIKAKGAAVTSFYRDKNELIEFFKNLGELHNAGYSIEWKNIYPNIGEFVELPNYAWQKERYWFDTKPDRSLMSLQPATTENKIQQNLYHIEWEEFQLNLSYKNKDILIIKDNYNHYIEIENKLKQKGCKVTSIDLNENPEGIKTDMVIHLSSFFKESPFNFYLECGILSLQKLINYFNKTNQHPKICVITNGGFVINNDTKPNLNASLITGVLRTLENEHEEINFLQIDVSNNIQEPEIEQVTDLVFAEDKYKEIAVRADKKFTSTIERVENISSAKTIQPEKTYIVVGGTSGLGLETVKWLSEKNAKKIWVISRSGAKGKTLDLFDDYNKNGISVKDIKEDVSNMEALKSIIEDVTDLGGVFYAAGILEDATFENLTKDQFENVISSKAIGAWNLHLLTEHLNPDFFVLYSSAAGIVGSAGQANYNAANTFLDALAHYRNANHKNAIAADFGTIAEIGLASRQENRGDRLAEQGVTAILPNELSAYFDKLFLSNETQIMPLDIDFEKWAKFNHSVLKNNFYKNVVSQKKSEEQSDIKTDIENFTNLSEALKHIKSQIKQFISASTKLNVSKIKEDETFKSLGVDSLHALQLKNKIQDEFNLQLNVSVVWQYPTVNKLADFIAKELKLENKISEKKEEVKTPSGNIKNDIESEVKKLSLEELMKELNSKLD
jgi:acyl transferase domain-containing protein/acyl carrier protein/NADP-dependent 3-hydroxy acid dehydrogenase YdfG